MSTVCDPGNSIGAHLRYKCLCSGYLFISVSSASGKLARSVVVVVVGVVGVVVVVVGNVLLCIYNLYQTYGQVLRHSPTCARSNANPVNEANV